MKTETIQTRRPPFNAQMMAGAMRVVRAIEALSQNNFTVVSVELSTPSRPTINIQTCGNCRRMIEKGEAVYFSFGRDTYFGPYRQGQFELGGCRIVWTEMGN
ncbi:hypothetical protein [Chromobacterium sp. IIBBL 290-4]|uniref:hypothetical protein n=1 Tax=Chromobacterium sp. IIBBL 290-4 TaxID=2953890 RepID=UPI0020B8282C|nr:hypothetical protein [Chromobacterium sp. IIBBL 290-4]UTH73947.1 hypothetical protein NKT35_20760 [Chromobacterium sp. IIBBL 290-4]